MWSTVSEVYPSYLALSQAPQGSVRVVEPQVSIQLDYRLIQPPLSPYETQQHIYSRRLWLC